MTRARLALLGLVVLVTWGHVGSPDAWYEGTAGPYAVLVHIEVPRVVPGIAVVNVRVDGADVGGVTAVADHADATGGAPPPEVAEPVAGQPGWYRTRVWLMTTGSYSVTVAVAGARGSGTALVPVVAMPLRRLAFGGTLAVILGALAVFLLVGLLTLVGAAVREGVLVPGVRPDPARRQRARRAMARASLVLAVLLLGGWRWWRSEDERFDRSRFRPLASSAAVDGARLTLSIDDSLWAGRDREAPPPPAAQPRGALIPDHGKLMHLFLIAEDGGAFAHLHPQTDDSVRFTAALPPLAAGRYRVFADIVQESGFSQTLVAAVELHGDASQRGADPTDPDDSWRVGDAAESPRVTLEDGSTLTWLRGEAPLVAGVEAPLRFAVAPPSSSAAPLEPYLGMAAHAAVEREDGLVFVHLHPAGTISMAAQMRFEGRQSPGGHRGMVPEGALPGRAAGDTIAFPYAFPEPGRYRVWVQMKRAGRILTGAFVAPVAALNSASR